MKIITIMCLLVLIVPFTVSLLNKSTHFLNDLLTSTFYSSECNVIFWWRPLTIVAFWLHSGKHALIVSTRFWTVF